MEQGKTATRMERKTYSNSFRSLEAIWEVLRRHSSPRRPLTVREICGYLKEWEEEPSADTIERMFPAERGLMGRLFPGIVAEEGGLTAVSAYEEGETLHIVVETPEGAVLAQDGLTLEGTRPPFRAPSYSTVDKLLKLGFPLDVKTFPYRLRCVAEEKGKDGRVRLIPYEEWEDRLAAKERRGGKAAERNNCPRRYYLANALTDGEWRIFSDLVQVYPFITEGQTKKFLTALNHLRPPKPLRPASRYAFKRGSKAMFAIIALLDRAIQARRKVRVTYGEYHLELKHQRWVPVLVPRKKNGLLDFEPYALMWSNGNYYLVGRNRGMMNLRVDRIMKAEVLGETFELPADFIPEEYRDRSPVMYPGQRALVRMRCKESMLGVLTDFFGSVPEYTPRPGQMVEASMSVAPAGAKLFALQYIGSVEVLEPESLRQEIAQELEAALNTYRS